ncbi:MAG: glycosyltransferase family 2 protein [Proteobacteria bacterium]|nr:glycosyltransferase family 2 protein [Pseudomonadota bacterium]
MDIRSKCPLLSIIVPCFNEEEALSFTHEKLAKIINVLAVEGKIDKQSFICFVDDGSTDNTWMLISELCKAGDNTRGLRLSKNEGHQTAILAGLLKVKGLADCAITIDADLQQDEEKIPEFVEKYLSGSEIVYGVRRDRNSDNIAKKITALSFYSLMRHMGVPLIVNHADYRLVSAKVIELISDYKEVNLFLRGIFSDLGFKTDQVVFDVKERSAGETKYTFFKMLKLAIDGITSFSVVPLRFVTLAGLTVSAISMVMILVIFISKFVPGMTIKGWSSTIISMYFLGGIQIFALGIIGEYIGKIYQEVKRRPRFFIEEELD